jgi:hypothetical protein
MSLFVDQLDPSVESYYADRHILPGKCLSTWSSIRRLRVRW